MNGHRLWNTFSRILSGYAGFFRALLLVAAIAGVSTAAGAAIVYPLWSLATTDADAYSVLVGALFSAALAYLLVRRLAAARGRYGSAGAFLRDAVQPAVRRIALVLLALLGLYVLLLLYARALYVAAAAGTAAYLLAFGYLMYARRNAVTGPRGRR